MAFGYYWYVIVVYLWSEQAAYHLSELIEDHAYNTYDTFLLKNEAKLKAQPVPEIARKYYEEVRVGKRIEASSCPFPSPSFTALGQPFPLRPVLHRTRG